MFAKFDLLQLLRAISGALRAQWDRELRAQIPELGAARAAVILQLGRGGGASHTRLSRLLGHRQITVSRLLDSLERRGWVHREAMPTDRRTWAARLTDDGKHVLFAIHTAQLAFVNRICTALDEERGTVLGLILATLETGARIALRTFSKGVNPPTAFVTSSHCLSKKTRKTGAPEGIRTPDLQIRSLVRNSVFLRVFVSFHCNICAQPACRRSTGYANHAARPWRSQPQAHLRPVILNIKPKTWTDLWNRDRKT